MNTSDTITAPASGTGGAITVLRISGPRAVEIADTVWKGRKALAAARVRQMYLGKIGIPTGEGLTIDVCIDPSLPEEGYTRLEREI